MAGLRLEASLVELSEEPEPDGSDAARALAWLLLEECAERGDAVVGELAQGLERRRGRVSSTAGNFVADLLREEAGADVGLHNKGGLRADVGAGLVRRRDLFELLPFENTLVVLELEGRRLEEAVRRGVEGRVRSGLEVSGLRVRFRRLADAGYELVGLDVGAEPLERERVYRVATNSFLAAGGDGYLDPAWARSVRDTRLVLHTLAERAFTAGRLLVPADDRYERVLGEGER